MTIGGTHFTCAYAVNFGLFPATTFAVNSATHVTVTARPNH